jgi:large subunit ribosomal protein L10
MNRVEKAEFIDDLKQNLAKANAAFITHYRGMTVEKLYDLRKKVHESDGQVQVVKNRLAKLAIKGSFAEGLDADFQGPVALVLSYKDPVAVAKAIVESMSEDNPLMLKSGSLEGKVIGAKDVEALSKLPDKDTLLSMLCSALQGPSRNLACVLAAVPRGLVNVLTAVRDQKAQGTGA